MMNHCAAAVVFQITLFLNQECGAEWRIIIGGGVFGGMSGSFLAMKGEYIFPSYTRRLSRCV
ncbi:hypothetical protein [Xenorhabdus kozodoii]|uniref:hypothetical protein n=1 Tax=Xenorhabdus kozodoii TaxID=351676 RepID=UPI00142E0B7E|nr:hypothetical protein [Xenorhabdus kozodoii]